MMNNEKIQQMQEKAKGIYNNMLGIWPAGSGENELVDAMVQINPDWCREKAGEIISEIKKGIENGREAYDKCKQQINEGKKVEDIIVQPMDSAHMDEAKDEIIQNVKRLSAEGSEAMLNQLKNAQAFGAQEEDSEHSRDERALALAVSCYAACRDAMSDASEAERMSAEEIGRSAGVAAEAGKDIEKSVEKGIDIPNAVGMVLGIATTVVVVDKLMKLMGVVSLITMAGCTTILGSILSVAVGITGLCVTLMIGYRLGLCVSVGATMIAEKIMSLFGRQAKKESNGENHRPIRSAIRSIREKFVMA